jgi:GNAT superfamily N-acetyltransferase
VGFLLEKCTFRPYNQEILDSCEPFDCGNSDLNGFFSKDVIKYTSELLGKSYCFTLDENPKVIVCAFTVSNDSIKVQTLPNSRKKKVTKRIPREKETRSYPSVLIGRLGVNKNFGRLGVGSDLMDFIKSWFVHPGNKTGCRFIVVDSYNTPKPLLYYTNNGFEPLFSTEEQEKEAMNLPLDKPLKTRLLYFDLILLKIEEQTE